MSQLSASYPTIKPSLNLDFARTKTLDPRITFTRSSTATYFDELGILRTAAAGVARFDHNPTTGESLGLLIEEQRANLLTYSEQFDNAVWGKGSSTIATNTVISPDGTLNADKLQETSVTSSFSCVSGPAMALNTTYTLSLYMKAAERSFGILNIYTGTASCWTWYNLNTGVVSTLGAGATATITSAGNGWYRCTLTISTASTGSPNIGIWPANADGSISYAGTAGFGIYIWGAQLEAGSVATSYIPTVASSVTRAADNATMTGTNFSSWYRGDEGTLYAEAQHSNSANYPVIAGISDSSSASNQIFFYTTSAGAPGETLFVRVNDSIQANINSGAIVTNGTFFKTVGAYKTNDFAVSLNGAAVVTDTSGAIPVVDRVFIGASINQSNYWLNGTIKRIAYYPARLTNAQLQTLTT